MPSCPDLGFIYTFKVFDCMNVVSGPMVELDFQPYAYRLSTEFQFNQGTAAANAVAILLAVITSISKPISDDEVI